MEILLKGILTKLSHHYIINLTSKKRGAPMKRKPYILALPLISLILEILPYGAVCNFANPEGTPFRETFSYFSLVPFGYANFFPLFTGIFTCIVLILSAVYILKQSHSLLLFTEFISWITFALSLCPLLFGLNFYSVTGFFISLSQLLQAILLHIISLKNKKEK